MSNTLKESIERQRASLFNMLVDPLSRAAARAARAWDDPAALDALLMERIRSIPYARFMYALRPDGVQISANATQHEMEEHDRGRDRSGRPYMREASQDKTVLSDAYISLRANRPSVTALQPVSRDGEHIGYIGVDFDLRRLPLTRELYEEPGQWQQLRGDPAIRGQVFHQSRVESRMDRHIDEVLPVMEELITDNGIFHGKLHFSSSRATIWQIDDPFRYRLLNIDALTDPDIVLACPERPYPASAKVPGDAIKPILDTFKHLRFADETIYLRAGSINIFNGLVGLNFSCDGSHYIPFEQFLAKDSEFWEGM